MAKHLWRKKIYAYGTRRISKDTNKLTFDAGRQTVDWADAESDLQTVLKGLHTLDLMLSGAIDEEVERDLLLRLVADEAAYPFSYCAGNGSVGSPALALEATLGQLRWTGERGALAGFEVPLHQQTKWILGQVLFNSVYAPAEVIDGAVVGTGVELGPVGAGEELLLFYHPLAPPGAIGTDPTLDGVLESDVDNTFAAPTSRVVLPQVDDAAGFVAHALRIDGDTDPVTDEWWRLNFNAPGGTDDPEFWVLAVAGIRAKE